MESDAIEIAVVLTIALMGGLAFVLVSAQSRHRALLRRDRKRQRRHFAKR
jgi:hypothetical protein